MGTGSAKSASERFDCGKDTAHGRMLKMWGIHNSCIPLSFERHRFHKAPQEEISPKTPECRSRFRYYVAFGIKMVKVGLGAINTCEN